MRMVPVLLSGGIGSRLWPVSTLALPKQLQPLTGGHTMIQATAIRVAGIDAGIHKAQPPIVVCGDRHAEEIRRQLADVGIPPALLIGEPVGKNTAAAIALAALAAPGDATLLVLPSDHVILDRDAFNDAALQAVEAARSGRLVMFGIIPDRPETGYGYIEVAERTDSQVLDVVAFVEKPDMETAAAFVSDGRHFWNGGMFAFTADVVLAALQKHAPEVLEGVRAAMADAIAVDGIVRPGPEFESLPSISFDHAVMEHTELAAVIPLDAGWSDVGSWATLWEIGERDESGNVVRGDVTAIDVRDSLLWSDTRTMAVVGLDNVVVVETADAVLVMARDRSQDVKVVWEMLERRAKSQ